MIERCENHVLRAGDLQSPRFARGSHGRRLQIAGTRFGAFFARVLLTATTALHAADWPMWRYDAMRSAASPEELPPQLHLQWTRQYSPRVQVWDDPLNQDLMAYDRIFEPVVLGERVFIGFNDADKVTALDLRSGKELWEFFTDGQIGRAHV